MGYHTHPRPAGTGRGDDAYGDVRAGHPHDTTPRRDPLDTLLAHLERVRPAGDNQHRSSCPTDAHPRGDRSRGLYVRRVDDRVLIHCRAGCPPAEIVQAAGLTLADLFDQPRCHSRGPVPIVERWDYRGLLRCLDAEAQTVRAIARHLYVHRQIDDSHVVLLERAAHRIGGIAEVSRG